MRRLFGHSTPVGASRRAISAASARKRAAGTITGTPSGIGASSSTRTKSSATTRPALTSRIDTLPERFDANALDGVEKNLVGPRAQLQIRRHDILDHVGYLGIGHGRANERTQLGVLISLPADRDLEKLLAILLDAEEPDMADVMVAAGIDTARDVDVQPPEAVRELEIAKSPRQLLRHRDRARVGEAAIVETWASDDIGDEPHVGRRHADGVKRAPQRRQIALRHMRQHQVLLMSDPDLAEGVAVGKVSDCIHLLGGRIAGRAALGLER